MKRVLPWLGIASILCIIFATVYGTAQQTQRSEANYPQIQIAEDTASSLDNGAQAMQLTIGHVQMASSLAPFTIIYTKAGQVVSGSGYLNGSVPKAPIGILRAADNAPYHVVTWEPLSGVRIAAVTVAAKGYYVLSGRSLYVVEQNENASLVMSVVGLICSLLVLCFVSIMWQRYSDKR